MKFYNFLIVFFIANSCILNAQISKPTKEESLKIDSIYQSFSDAYATFNAEKMSNCYAENAVSIAHYEGKKPFILNGKKAILNDCNDFFNAIKSNKQTLKIEFKIIERTLNNGKIFDIGYYKLIYLKDNKIMGIDYGKVAIILAKNAENKWHYETDTNSTASELEFNKAN
jgi:hypothetical protein